MNCSTIKSHLGPFKIIKKRKTTINHAFAAAIVPHDEYDEVRVKNAVQILGQNPDEPLRCVYCNSPAQTWDHVFGTVKNSRFSGHGHRIGNLLPSCKSCNSSKGNKNWKAFLNELSSISGLSENERLERESSIDRYLEANVYSDAEPINSPDYERYLEIKDRVFELLTEADELAKQIRDTTTRKY